MRFSKFVFVFTLIYLASFAKLEAQEWVVPDDQKGKVAPFLFTPDHQKSGEGIYIKNCVSCHGNMGKNNWAKITPPPGDLAEAKHQKQSDGELYYRITTGKAPMPEFRNILTDEERWWVIAYLRTFNPTYVQPNPAAAGSFSGRMIMLAMEYDSAKNRIQVTAKEITKENGQLPAKGVEVMLLVKRYFGNMQLGDPKTTGESGTAFFDFPADLPGDKEGSIELVCRVNDASGKITSAPVIKTLTIGVPTDKPGLTETRAWWSARDKAPIWIIATYTLTVLIVWSIIIYIVISVIRIRRYSN